MSLTRFLKMPDVAAKTMVLRPKLPRKIPAALQVEPRSARHMMVGTAFDYLLRFEIQRRAVMPFRNAGWPSRPLRSSGDRAGICVSRRTRKEWCLWQRINPCMTRMVARK